VSGDAHGEFAEQNDAYRCASTGGATRRGITWRDADPEATAGTGRSGELHAGDLGTFADENFLTIDDSGPLER
jgi:hypothetical protein